MVVREFLLSHGINLDTFPNVGDRAQKKPRRKLLTQKGEYFDQCLRDHSISRQRWRGREGVNEILDKQSQIFRGKGIRICLLRCGKIYIFLPLSCRNFNIFSVYSFNLDFKYPIVIAFVSSCTYLVIIMTYTYVSLFLKVIKLLLDLGSYIFLLKSLSNDRGRGG